VEPLLVAIGVVLAVWVALIALLYALGRRDAAIEAARFIPNLIALFRGLLGDPRVPRRAKVLLAIGALWLASPIDLVPEFLPVIGPLDDAVMAALVLRYVVGSAGRDVVIEHWRGDPAVIERLLRLVRM
jgi:uncharacterized membrane protein YkvA (DUF1232 family)